MFYKKYIITLVFLLISFFNYSQIDKDSLFSDPSKFKLSATILSGSLITIGVIGLESHTIKDISNDINEERDEHIDDRFTIDDFAQYSQVAVVYGLNAFGVEGKNDFGDRTIAFATAHLIMTSAIFIIKSTSNVQRPDGSAFNSFPSGHTATAFMGAEFLWQEYKHESVWYGISGYGVAALTGTFRIYNDRHWLNDVIAGAGIGILSTKIAYWLLPTFKTLFKKKDSVETLKNTSSFSSIIVPCIGKNSLGVAMKATF